MQLAFAVVALLAVLGLANAQAKIIMTPTSGIIDKASKITISLKLTEPIICNDPHAYCGVTILFTNANPKQITLSSCHVEWVRDQWTEVKNLTIQAVENFVDDGQKSFSLITEPADSESEFYNKYDLPDIALTTKSRPAGQCSSLTDPHIFQFDGADFVDLTAGTFMLWQAPMRDFEVHTRVADGRNCGVAMRDRCDLVVMDRCSGSPVIRTDFKSTIAGQPVVTRLSGGATYIVDFPRSGASIKVNFVSRVFQVGRQSCGWSGCVTVYDSHTEYWIDVFATAPGADWGYYPGTTSPRTFGLCGSFDSQRSNDPKVNQVSNYKIPTGQSLFDRTVSCSPIVPEVVDYSRCTYVPPKVQKPVISYPDSEVVTDLLKSIVLRKDDPRVTYQFEETSAVVPSFTAAEEANAEAFCTKAISESPAALACQAIGVDLQKFIASCTLDMLYQGDIALVDGSVQAMKENCHFVASTNVSLFDVSADGSLVVSDEQLNLGSLLTCPNDCSFQGTCKSGVCDCNPGFTGADCFTSTSDLPILNRIVPAQYDARSTDPSPSAISLLSDNFVQDVVQCKINGVVSTVAYLSVNEILCYFPANYTNNGAIEKFVNVSYSNDGAKWSTPLLFTFFDSGCRQCTEKGVCSDKPNSCKVNGKCYAPGDASSTNACLTCQPTVSTTKLGYSYVNAAACGPVFSLPNYVVSVPEDQRLGVSFLSVNARNPLVAGDASNSYTYRVASVDSPFTVATTTGAVSLASPLNFETKDSYTVLVEAKDSASNTATVSVLVTVLDINEPPVFPQSAYTFVLLENTNTATLGTLIASDADTNATGLSWNAFTYSLNSFQFISFTDAFSINPTTGVLKTVAPLDYEKRSSYTFNVSATDGGKLSGSTTVTLNLVNVNEPPTFIGLDHNSIDENSAENTVVGTLYTDDPDNNQIFTYTLLDNAGGLFKLATDGAGVTTLVAGSVAINYETKSSYTVSVKSVDNGSPAYSVSMSFAVIVNDVNDAPSSINLYAYPIWEADHMSSTTPASVTTTTASGTVVSNIPFVTMSEATKPGIVATFITVDQDLGQSFTYTLKSNPGNYFQISDDRLVLVNPISYQVVKSVTLVVVATDSGIPSMSTASVSFTIAITDANQPPSDAAFTGPVAVSELATPGTAVGTVTAIEDPNRDFVFTINDPNSKFAVGSTSCAQTSEGTRCSAPITLKGSLDYETTPVETLVITGTCTNNSLSAVFNLPVPIVDKNEAPAGATLTTSTIVEGSTSGTVVGSIVVNDPDKGDSNTVQLVDDANGRFRLVTSTTNGVTITDVVVNDGFSIDFEDDSSLSVTVRVTDKSGLSNTFVIPVSVLDAPVVVKVATPTVTERTATGSVVSAVSVTGLDRADQKARLTLSNDANGAFVLSDNTLSPKLLVADASKLDAAVATKLTVTFSVSFTSTTSTPLPTVTSSVDITVANVNESPVLTVNTQQTITEIPDDSSVGTEVFAVSAVDPDASDVVTFAITSGNDLQILDIDASTGAVTLAIVPNHSSVKMNSAPISVVITATDLAGASASVTVMVRFVDNCAENPCFNDGVCIDRVNTYYCSCLPGTDGPQCENADLTVDFGDFEASKGTSGIAAGAAAGIAIGVIAIVALIALIALFVIRTKNKPSVASTNSITSVLYDTVDDVVPLAKNPKSEYADFAPFAVTDAFIAGASNPLYSWYQPESAKDDCMHQLTDAPLGTFIIRDFAPTPGWHMLMVKTKSSVQMEKIRLTPDGTYQLAGETFRPRGRLPSFNSIPELVQHYASPDQMDLPVTLSVESPIYDNTKLMKGTVKVQEADEMRPSLPLRGHEALAVSAVADSSNGDLYLNQVEARRAVNARHNSLSVNSTYAGPDSDL